MTQREFYTDTELSKIFEESDSEFDFSDESEFNDKYSTGSESESESEDISDAENLQENEIISDEDEGEIENVNNWKKYSANDPDFTRLPFTVLRPGIQIPNNGSCEKEIDFFLFLQIVHETNRYAAEKIKKCKPLPKYSIWTTWKEVNLEEMKAFLGVIMNMALNPKSEMKDFFSQNWLNHMPFFTDVFSRAS